MLLLATEKLPRLLPNATPTPNLKPSVNKPLSIPTVSSPPLRLNSLRPSNLLLSLPNLLKMVPLSEPNKPSTTPLAKPNTKKLLTLLVMLSELLETYIKVEAGSNLKVKLKKLLNKSKDSPTSLISTLMDQWSNLLSSSLLKTCLVTLLLKSSSSSPSLETTSNTLK